MSEQRGTAALPAILPIFPLAGVLLLPRGHLPLNIFEPRYLAMTRDALAGDAADRHDPAERSATSPPPATRRFIRPAAPAASASFSETEDGRFLITLTGVCRFRIREELPLLSGYRRVVPEWGEFARRPR